MKNIFSAIYGHWKEDTPLFLLEAPQGQEKPYCLMVPVSLDPEYTFDSVLDYVSLQFSVFSDRGSATECLELMEKVYRAFDDAKIPVEGYSQTLGFERDQNRILREDDVWHGIIEYEIILHR